jgi:hypothetical protein
MNPGYATDHIYSIRLLSRGHRVIVKRDSFYRRYHDSYYRYHYDVLTKLRDTVIVS